MAHFFLQYSYKDQVIFLFHECNILPYSFEEIRGSVVLVVTFIFIFLCSLCGLCFLWVLFSFFFFLMNLFRLFIKLEALLFYHVTLVVPRCPFTFKSEKLNRWLKNSACLGGIYLSIGATHCSAVGLWKKISASVGLLALGWSSLQRIFQYVVWSLHLVVNSLGIEKGRSGFH